MRFSKIVVDAVEWLYNENADIIENVIHEAQRQILKTQNDINLARAMLLLQMKERGMILKYFSQKDLIEANKNNA
jgi:hypothetical protein